MDTTINIRSNVLHQITLSAQASGLSRSDLIVVLIKKSMNGITNPGRMGKLVKYQKRSVKADWHSLHISVGVDEYEYLLDLRKLLKMSVSLILAYAVKKFLSKTKNNHIADNNLFKHYTLFGEVIDGLVCWKFVWGFPPDPGKFMHQESNRA